MALCLLIFLPQTFLFQHNQSRADRELESGSSEQRLRRYMGDERKQAQAVTSEAAEKLLSAGDLKLHSPPC